MDALLKQKAKDAHLLSVKRSQGAERKFERFDKYSEETGYMGYMVLKPTWPRGKPRAIKTKNWQGPLIVPKEGRVGIGSTNLVPVTDFEIDIFADGPSSRGDVIGSPRTYRPLAAQATKKGKKKSNPERCHACGKVFNKDDDTLWIRCGGQGPKGKGCNTFAAHASCWNIRITSKTELKVLCRKFIRCSSCQELENDEESSSSESESDGEVTNNRGPGNKNSQSSRVQVCDSSRVQVCDSADEFRD